MGKKFAPAYANIFMVDCEEKAIQKCTKKPLHYLRYLDDIWGIWTFNIEEFKKREDIPDNFYDNVLKHLKKKDKNYKIICSSLHSLLCYLFILQCHFPAASSSHFHYTCPPYESRLTGKGEEEGGRHAANVAGSGNRTRDGRIKDSRPPNVGRAMPYATTERPTS
ncbi:hypothetical protein CCH79_00019465, partial [Gambusia affinis]